MDDLLVALRASGWRLMVGEEHPPESADPFTLEDDKVKWGLESTDGAVLELEFHAFADLGQRTDKLRDILYCLDAGTGRKLYFDKRQSAEWKANVSAFVSLLGKADGDHDADT